MTEDAVILLLFMTATKMRLLLLAVALSSSSATFLPSNGVDRRATHCFKSCDESDGSNHELLGTHADTEGPTLTETLAENVIDLFESVDDLPVSISQQRGNVEVRTKWDGNRMLTFGEAKNVAGYHPDEFKAFLEDFVDAFPLVNPMVRRVVPLEVDGDKKREGIKSILKFPFPLTDRVMVHWKYLRLGGDDRDKDVAPGAGAGDTVTDPHEHMLVISERDNEDLLAKHLSLEERRKYVLARTFLCAYWVRPVYDSKDRRIVGSNIRYLFSGDTGGSIPQWIQNAVGPKTALDSVKGLIEYVKKGGGCMRKKERRSAK